MSGCRQSQLVQTRTRRRTQELLKIASRESCLLPWIRPKSPPSAGSHFRLKTTVTTLSPPTPPHHSTQTPSHQVGKQEFTPRPKLSHFHSAFPRRLNPTFPTSHRRNVQKTRSKGSSVGFHSASVFSRRSQSRLIQRGGCIALELNPAFSRENLAQAAAQKHSNFFFVFLLPHSQSRPSDCAKIWFFLKAQGWTRAKANSCS